MLRQYTQMHSAILRSPPDELGSVPVSDGVTISHLKVTPEIKLRSLVGGSGNTKGTVLFLHGFPETLFVWNKIARVLSNEYEVHAFDWPGYGQSSRPSREEFSYAPKDYAGVLKAYIKAAGIDCSKLTIYATDIGSLPVLLAALDEPDIARNIFVGDFAPFNRPEYMSENLQNLKSEPTASGAREYFRKAGVMIPANAHRAGLSPEEQYELQPEVLEDMTNGWANGDFSSGDAFYFYYSHFSRDQEFFEQHIGNLKTPVKVIWGEKDAYINKKMGEELSKRIAAPLEILPGISHYPHLQKPSIVVDLVRKVS